MNCRIQKLCRISQWSVLAILLVSITQSFGGQDLSPKNNEAAQKIYTAKCAKCHQFYDPKSYSQVEWDGWMQKMKKKAKLKADQFDLVSRYLDGLRAEKPPESKPK